MLVMSCVCHAFTSVHCCRVVTCWERADLLALFCDVCCDSVTFPFGILGQVWYLIVSIPNSWCLSDFEAMLYILEVSSFSVKRMKKRKVTRSAKRKFMKSNLEI